MADAKSNIDPKYKGEKTYRLTQPHYRLGRLYQPGELITVVDEVPGRSWLPYDAKAEAAAKAEARLAASRAPAPDSRPSDTSP